MKFDRKRQKKWSWGHCGYYKRIWCDSSWELAFLLYHLDHGTDIKRNNRGFVYKYYGKKRKYYPDFIIDGEYIEIKGKLDKKSQSKIKQFRRPLKVVGVNEITPYLDYAKKTYGETFHKMLK